MNIYKRLEEAVAGCDQTDAELIGDLLQPQDRGAEFLNGANYVWRWAVGRVFRPKLIVEFGTRFGYGLKVITDGAGWPPSEYRFWIIDDERDGYPCLDIGIGYLQKMGMQMSPPYQCDTRNVRQGILPTDADLAIADACHTFAGALKECGRGWHSLRSGGGCLLLDDCNVPDVEKALCHFTAMFDLQPIILPTANKLALMVKE